MKIDNAKSVNAIKKKKKKNDNMEGKCKQIGLRKSSQRKEYSYVYFVLRTR